jgi:hypothetical protein
VLLQTDEHGIVTWAFPQEPAEGGPRLRGSRTRTYVLAPTYAAAQPGTRKRGGGAIVSKLLEVFAFPLLAPVGHAIAAHFARQWETANRRYALRRFGPTNYSSPEPSQLTAPEAASLSEGRSLLFVHGTFGRSHSAFPTVPIEDMRELDRRYQGRVFAFDHFTVTEDPAQNAQRFVDLLPPNSTVELDILCHSRGGLVGRAIAERSSGLGLSGRQLRVRKVVFAGAPNGGCVLANATAMKGLIDRYTNWAAWLPGPGVVDIFEGVIAVVKELAVIGFEGLTGLTAMNPEGPFLQKFNANAVHDGTYYALTSDYEPRDANIPNLARDAFMDTIFGEPNDLVVPCASVFKPGGPAAFPASDKHSFVPADGVDHGGYFADPIGRAKILQWLTGH